MPLTMLGTKLGMTRMFDDEGRSVPVTVIKVGPNVVTQLRTAEVDGYEAVQIGFDDVSPRNSTMPMIGHDAKAKTAPKRHHCEFVAGDSKLDLPEFELGMSLDLALLEKLPFVDVSGVSKGKGTQGTMKRHNFAGLEASHGVERKHRSAGSIGGHATNTGTGPKVKKGKKMAGRMGNERVTVRSLPVVKVIAGEGVVLVKGPVPGPNKGLVELREPTRLYKGKAAAFAESLG